MLFVFSCGKKQDNAKYLFDQGKYKEAIEVYDQKMGMEGNNASSLYNRGRCYEELGQIKEAVKDYERVLGVDNRHEGARLSLAGIAYNQKEFARALLLTNQVIAFQEKSFRAHFLQGRAQHQMGQAQQALESYNTTLSLNKDFGEAYLYRGAVKNSLKMASACDDFKKAAIMKVEGAKNAFEKHCKN